MESKMILDLIDEAIEKIIPEKIRADELVQPEMDELVAMVSAETGDCPKRLKAELVGIALHELTNASSDTYVFSFMAQRRLELLRLRLVKPAEYARHRAAFPPARGAEAKDGRFVVYKYLDSP